jgi:DNA-binding transcriptional LysR family regulator
MQLAARTHSILGLVAATKAGVGITTLPTALGDAEHDLQRILPVPELTRAWRLLVHPDARHEPRVAEFFDSVAEEGSTMHAILTG